MVVFIVMIADRDTYLRHMSEYFQMKASGS